MEQMYKDFIVKDFTIGSTTYRQEDCSPVLAQVYIKTFQDKGFRPLKDFFGEQASSEAYSWIQERITQ
jgi:hypothetical protein